MRCNIIISYPTGFYSTVLPQDPSDNTSVTFVISNSVPPRTELIFPKLPSGVENRQRVPNLVFDRNKLGELIFTVSEANQTTIDNNSKLFEIGQILEFFDSAKENVEPMLVAKLTEIRHNTNQYDYIGLGLDENDVAIINNTTIEKLANLQIQLNQAKSDRSDAERTISLQQKLINDLQRNIAALEVAASDMTDDEIYAIVEKLKVKLETAIINRDAAIIQANTNALLAKKLADDLRTLASIVK